MKHVVITGANRGIGLELCRVSKERGYKTTALCRASSDELRKLSIDVHENVELCDAQSVAKAVSEVQDVDILINNAGIMAPTTLGELDQDAIRRQFETNAMAPLRLSESMLPKLSAHAKIALITSRMGSVSDNTSGGHYGYRMSKAALNAAGMSLAMDLKSKGIAVAILHPGFVKTDMTGQQGPVPAPKAAAQIWQRIDETTLDNTGSFRHANGESLDW